MIALEPAILDWLTTRSLSWFGEVPSIEQIIDSFYGQVCVFRLGSGERRVVKHFRIAGFARFEARTTAALAHD